MAKRKPPNQPSAEEYALIAGMLMGTAPSMIHNLGVVINASTLPRDLQERLRVVRDDLTMVNNRAINLINRQT